jgi:histone deacetylase complex regulatory component SIN3
MQFSRAERPRIQAAHPHFSLADISAELGRRWQLLSVDERHRLKLAAAAASPASLSAVDWLDHVKLALHEAAFADLLLTLAQFKARAIDVRDVTLRVAALLHGHRDLILGFNAFLPADVAITPAMLDEHDRLRPDALPLPLARRTPSPAPDDASHSSTMASTARVDDVGDVDVAAVVDHVIAKAAAASSSSSTPSSPTKQSTPRRRRPRSVELRAPASIGEQASAFAARLNAELDVRLRSNFVALLESVVEKERSVADFANKASTLFANNAQLADELFAFLPLHTATLLAALSLPASPPPPPAAPAGRAHTLRAGTGDSPGAAGDGGHRHRRHDGASPRAQTMRGHRKASKSPSSHRHSSPADASVSSPTLNANRKKTRE